MGRRAVAAEIARLEALGRTRALADWESRHLALLISAERKYDGSDRRSRERHREKLREATREPLVVPACYVTQAKHLLRKKLFADPDPGVRAMITAFDLSDDAPQVQAIARVLQRQSAEGGTA